MEISSTTRQLFVVASTQLAALSVGSALTYPSILLQQLSANDTSIVLDLDTSSWIGSIHGIAGIPSICMPAIMQWRGRKFAFIIACVASVIGWILAITATNTVTILISESFHGFGNNSILAVSLLSISEMVAPRIRNVSMLTYHLMQAFGMNLCGILGRYLHWKTLSMILCVPIFVAMLMAFKWPESPSWLAYKGKFEQCERAFVWLRGVDKASKKELQELISAQKENLILERRKSCAFTENLRKLLNRDFYMPCIHMFVMLYLVYSCGSVVILVYTVKMIKSATSNEVAAYYGSIIVNTIVFISVGISVILIRRFSNKPILLLTIAGTIFSLLGTSLSSYLQTNGILSKDSLIGLIFLLFFTMSISVGIPITFTVAAELMPVKHRGEGGALYVIFTCLLHSVTLKIAPYLFISISFWGTLLLYAANTTVCGLYVWKYIPETKGRTLQELEDFYTYGHFAKTRASNDVNDHLNPLHNK